MPIIIEQPYRQSVAHIPVLQLIQWKAALKLEKVGLKHSSGRSVRKFVCERLNLPARTKHQDVIDIIQALLDDFEAAKNSVNPN